MMMMVRRFLWVVFVLVFYYPMVCSGGDAMDGYRLEVMRKRAELFSLCVAAKSATEGIVFREQKMTTYEIMICKPKKVAFVHVYKAAGTTVTDLLARICPESVVIFSSWDDRALAAEMWAREFAGLTTFTFVRDPLERFQSGVFEVSSRGGFEDKVERAFRENRTVGSVVVDDLLKSRGNQDVFVDPHVQQQTSFLVDQAKLVAPIDYIGVVSPMFAAELVTVGTEILGVDRQVLEAHIREDHARDSSDTKYAAAAPIGPFGTLRHEKLEHTARAKAYDYYRIDYDCLGFGV